MLIHSPKELALLIMRQRKKLGLSQSALGDLVGLKQKTLSALENNPETIKLSTLFRALSALNLDIVVTDKTETRTDKTRWKKEW